MARAYGSSAHLLMKCETVYGSHSTTMKANFSKFSKFLSILDNDPVLDTVRIEPPPASLE